MFFQSLIKKEYFFLNFKERIYYRLKKGLEKNENSDIDFIKDLKFRKTKKSKRKFFFKKTASKYLLLSKQKFRTFSNKKFYLFFKFLFKNLKIELIVFFLLYFWKKNLIFSMEKKEKMFNKEIEKMNWKKFLKNRKIKKLKNKYLQKKNELLFLIKLKSNKISQNLFKKFNGLEINLLNIWLDFRYVPFFNFKRLKIIDFLKEKKKKRKKKSYYFSGINLNQTYFVKPKNRKKFSLILEKKNFSNIKNFYTKGFHKFKKEKEYLNFKLIVNRRKTSGFNQKKAEIFWSNFTVKKKAWVFFKKKPSKSFFFYK
ncbi:hypothetical protein HAN_2g267 (nucleomorph) [Hemiselmis andersenii]|uniref:Uncharacterized protein n=1 Tax=Hemiselmis andersenii TaxID=464988 RepID=A9BKT6_HEMAN|nr:hypothetical protein HAN_2g267 [Hemiselmis andersenii]ABW98091.1 hypothetical protein HAN_2g267 [Hemiselmis andersenii]